jgi:hypothetical protein
MYADALGRKMGKEQSPSAFSASTTGASEIPCVMISIYD